MIELTEEAYAAAIPACCERQTLEAHKSMLLCWGLVAATEAGRQMNCADCDLATRTVFFRRPADSADAGRSGEK
jgi:hypothetical protein